GVHGGSRWTDELLNEKRQQGDQLADDAVDELFKRGDVQAEIRNGRTNPPSVPWDFGRRSVAVPRQMCR
ncbi:MAG TPA: hypothetical protein VGC05_22945, partial [Mycobacterium sp.]